MVHIDLTLFIKSFDWLRAVSEAVISVWYHCGLMKTNKQHFDSISSYIYWKTMSHWHDSTLIMQLLPKSGIYKFCKGEVSFLCGSHLYMYLLFYWPWNNKAITEFGSCRLWEIIRPSVCVTCRSLCTNQGLNNLSYSSQFYSIIV